MSQISLVQFGAEETHGYVLGARLPKAGPAYSPYLDVGYNHLQGSGWRDETAHLHAYSEEYFIVLQGLMKQRVGEETLAVSAGQLLGVRAGVLHQTVEVHPPFENFLIRVPGGGNDKARQEDIRHPAPDPGAHRDAIRLDLRQTFRDYPLGACLPRDHPHFSPLLDFTCVWDVDPIEEWKNDQRHYHSLREEYYFVLRGRLDFKIDSTHISVRAGQILGVKPFTTHQVIGGQGPADVLFVRVPGGRGDKVKESAA